MRLSKLVPLFYFPRLPTPWAKRRKAAFDTFLFFFFQIQKSKNILKKVTAILFHHFIWPSSFLLSYSCKDQFLGKALNNFENPRPLTGYFTANDSGFKGGGLGFLIICVCLFTYVCFSIVVLESFFVKRSNCDFMMHIVPFFWIGQGNRRKYSSKPGFALCYASACETNTRMMQKDIKGKENPQTKNSLIIIHFYSFFSLKVFSNY